MRTRPLLRGLPRMRSDTARPEPRMIGRVPIGDGEVPQKERRPVPQEERQTDSTRW